MEECSNMWRIGGACLPTYCPLGRIGSIYGICRCSISFRCWVHEGSRTRLGVALSRPSVGRPFGLPILAQAHVSWVHKSVVRLRPAIFLPSSVVNELPA